MKRTADSIDMNSNEVSPRQVALVTGASSGIGKEAARALIDAGYTVYAAARRVDRMADLAERGARLLAMDVVDDTAMVAGIEHLMKAEGRIDVLLNVAGFGSYGAIEDVSLAAARYQMEVNVFGAARLIQLVLPHMRQARAGKIVNVSSTGGRVAAPVGGWYHASKFALEALSDSLRLEVKPFGIDVIVIQPGGVKTEWADVAAQHLEQTARGSAYGDLIAKSAEISTKVLPHLAPPSDIARLIVKALAAKHPRPRYHAGYLATPMLCMRRLLSDRMLDTVIGSQLGIKVPRKPSSPPAA